MSNVKSALLVGVGGQGAILISKIMSNGFMKAGYDVKQSEVHGMAQRVHRADHVLLRHAEPLGDLRECWLAPIFRRHRLLTLQNAVRQIPHRPAHADRTVIPQIPPQLPRDHRHTIG